MIQNRFPFAEVVAAAFLLMLPMAAVAGPFDGPGGVATQTPPNTNFIQVKQLDGFTGYMPFKYVNNTYEPTVGNFEHLVFFSFHITCPAGYHVATAGVRTRGNDSFDTTLPMYQPGNNASNQISLQSGFGFNPWQVSDVQAIGIDALEAAGNKGPVFLSLEDELDTWVEYYGSCAPDVPSPGKKNIYSYDSAKHQTNLRPKTRMRYALQAGMAKAPGQILKATPTAPQRAVKKHKLRAPSTCREDCPPPAVQRRLAR